MSPDTSKLRQYDRGRDTEWDERKVAVALVRAGWRRASAFVAKHSPVVAVVRHPLVAIALARRGAVWIQKRSPA